MRCYEDEGSWNLSFSGAGFLGLYHVGVTRCFRERAPRLLQGARRIYGSSSGALNAVSIIADQSLGAWGPARAGGAGDAGPTLETRFQPLTSSMRPLDPRENPEDSG